MHPLTNCFYSQNWMTEVDCDGTEDDIFTCDFRGWGTQNCSDREGASVICSGIVLVTTTHSVL